MGEYNHKIAEEIILYILTKGHLKDNLKLYAYIYIADKLHLQRFGSFMFEENYKASLQGPVPTIVENFILQIDAGNAKSVSRSNDDVLVCQRPVDLGYISDACKECLDEALECNRPLDEFRDAAWKNAIYGEFISISKIASILPNADVLIQHLSDPYPEIEEQTVAAHHVQKPFNCP